MLHLCTYHASTRVLSACGLYLHEYVARWQRAVLYGKGQHQTHRKHRRSLLEFWGLHTVIGKQRCKQKLELPDRRRTCTALNVCMSRHALAHDTTCFPGALVLSPAAPCSRRTATHPRGPLSPGSPPAPCPSRVAATAARLGASRPRLALPRGGFRAGTAHADEAYIRSGTLPFLPTSPRSIFAGIIAFMCHLPTYSRTFAAAGVYSSLFPR